MDEDHIVVDTPLLAFVDGTGLLSDVAKSAIKRALDRNTSLKITDKADIARLLWFSRNIGRRIQQDLHDALDGKVCGDIRLCARCGQPFVTRKPVTMHKYCSWECKSYAT